MAKKVTGYIKLQIPAGKATPAPPVGPALGQHGVNIVQFTKEFNARTADQAGMIIPVVITVYADKKFQLYHQDPAGCCSVKKGLQDPIRFCSSQQDKGSHHQQGRFTEDC